MRYVWFILFLTAFLTACETTPPAQAPEPQPPAEPERQVFRPMEPIADDFDQPSRPQEPSRPPEPARPTEPVQPPEPAQPSEPPQPSQPPLSAAASCTPIDTIESVTFYKTADGTVSFAADMDVNTDGTLTSYSASDPGFFNSNGRLSTRRALNTICNGLKIVRPGPDLGPRECPQLLTAFAKFRDAGWPAQNADGDRIRFYAIETRKDAGPEKNEPCLADDDWMVSTTSIKMSGAYPACDPQAWLDARRVNAVVMPPQVLRAAGASAQGGDLVAVRYRGKVFGAIVGDTNPSRVGEGTISLTAALRALDPQPPSPPANLRDVYQFSIVRPPVEYFVFPGTRSQAEPITNARGRALAELAVAEAQRRGVLKARACGFDGAGARSLNQKRRTPEEGLNDDPDVLKDED
jgi:hypothetical protein